MLNEEAIHEKHQNERLKNTTQSDLGQNTN